MEEIAQLRQAWQSTERELEAERTRNLADQQLLAERLKMVTAERNELQAQVDRLKQNQQANANKSSTSGPNTTGAGAGGGGGGGGAALAASLEGKTRSSVISRASNLLQNMTAAVGLRFAKEPVTWHLRMGLKKPNHPNHPNHPNSS